MPVSCPASPETITKHVWEIAVAASRYLATVIDKDETPPENRAFFE
jgi:hypothetical protein